MEVRKVLKQTVNYNILYSSFTSSNPQHVSAAKIHHQVSQIKIQKIKNYLFINIKSTNNEISRF